MTDTNSKEPENQTIALEEDCSKYLIAIMWAALIFAVLSILSIQPDIYPRTYFKPIVIVLNALYSATSLITGIGIAYLINAVSDNKFHSRRGISILLSAVLSFFTYLFFTMLSEIFLASPQFPIIGLANLCIYILPFYMYRIFCHNKISILGIGENATPDYGAVKNQIQEKGETLTMAIDFVPPEIQPTSKNKYCKKCGSPIDHSTKKCTGCGKQYFKFQINKPFLVLIILVLSLACITEGFFIKKAQDDLEDMTELAIKHNRNFLEAELKSAKRAQQIDFYNRNIVFVTANGEKYHTYDCHYWRDSNKYVIYTLQDAQRYGYEPCSKCHPPQ